MSNNIKVKITFALLFMMVGCGANYSEHKRTIVAHLSSNNQPAANFPVQVIYPQDNYGVPFLKFRKAPKPIDTKLSENGTCEILIADFGEPHIVVGSTVFIANQSTIIKGGIPHKTTYMGHNAKGYAEYRKTYNAYNLPVQIYPEVDIELSKTHNQSLKRSVDTAAIRVKHSTKLK